MMTIAMCSSMVVPVFEKHFDMALIIRYDFLVSDSPHGLDAYISLNFFRDKI